MNLINLLRGRQNKKSERNDKNLEKLRNLGVNKELSTYKAFTDDCVKLDAESLPSAIQFSPKTDDLLIADDRGNITIIDSNTKIRHQWRGHHNAILSAVWTSDGEHVLCSSADRSISSWKRGKLTREFQSKNGAMRCLAPAINDPFVFAAGGRDCDICIYDERQKRTTVVAMKNRVLPMSHVEFVHFPGQPTAKARTTARLNSNIRTKLTRMQDKTVASIKFLNEYELISCGINDHTIKLWDIRKFRDYRDAKLILKSPTDRGFTSLGSLNNSIYASCLDGSVYEFGLNQTQTSPRRAFTGHACEGSGSIYLSLSVNSQLKKLLVGSTDGNARIYCLDNHHGVQKNGNTWIEVDGHQIGRNTDPVLYCSWSSQYDLIALASDDCVVSIFKSDHGLPDRLQKGADEPQNKVGEAENTKIKISYQHVQQKIESYAQDESIRELNEKISAISFRDPTKLNPWRHFNKKRKLEDDQDFIKNPRPVKKIILQPRITNARVSSPKSSPRSVRPPRSQNVSQPSILDFYKPKN